jgi:hypothetical protein
MSEENEKLIKNCNSMEEIRKAAAKNPDLEAAYNDSMQSPICLLTEVTSRLKLKDKPVQIESPCKKEAIEALWEKVHEADASVQRSDSKQAQLKSREKLSEFMEHCCVRRRYFFSIKKCGKGDCQFCKPPRLPQDVFERLSVFPDSVKKVGSDHVFGKSTTEKDRPSLSGSAKKKSAGKPSKPFRMTSETVCDVLVCGDCLKPRCLYSQRKLIQSEQIQLVQCKEDYTGADPGFQ